MSSQFPILDKLSSGDTDQTIQEILAYYDLHGSVSINYLYGANIVKHQLLDSQTSKYAQSLIQSDFLLPDGIALRTLWWIWYRLGLITQATHLHNLNGTDFIDHLLQYLIHHGYHIHLSILCNYDPRLSIQQGELIAGARRYLETQYHIPLAYAVDTLYGHPDTRNRAEYLQNLHAYRDQHSQTIPLILVCTGTPIQEIRIQHHRQDIHKSGAIALGQGGTLDFWSGREIRAAYWIRYLKMEALWRLLSHPHKNRKKFLISLTILRYIIRYPYIYCRDRLRSDKIL